MAILTITITDIPDLPTSPTDQRDALVKLGRAFGTATVLSGFRRLEDMPTQAAYEHGAAAARRLLASAMAPMSLALLVNLLADSPPKLSPPTPEPPQTPTAGPAGFSDGDADTLTDIEAEALAQINPGGY